MARPTDSKTPSTRSGNRAPDSKTWCAPRSAALARPCSVREVAQTRMPIARPSWINAVDTPPVAPCTRMVDPAGRPLRTASIR